MIYPSGQLVIAPKSKDSINEGTMSRMPDHIKIHICNAKYGHHGNGNKDNQFWNWWNSLTDQEKEQEVGK